MCTSRLLVLLQTHKFVYSLSLSHGGYALYLECFSRRNLSAGCYQFKNFKTLIFLYSIPSYDSCYIWHRMELRNVESYVEDMVTYAAVGFQNCLQYMFQLVHMKETTLSCFCRYFSLDVCLRCVHMDLVFFFPLYSFFFCSIWFTIWNAEP